MLCFYKHLVEITVWGPINMIFLLNGTKPRNFGKNFPIVQRIFLCMIEDCVCPPSILPILILTCYSMIKTVFCWKFKHFWYFILTCQDSKTSKTNQKKKRNYKSKGFDLENNSKEERIQDFCQKWWYQSVFLDYLDSKKLFKEFCMYIYTRND